LSKSIQNFFCEKVAQNEGYFCNFTKILQSTCPRGENSSNLVTLLERDPLTAASFEGVKLADNNDFN
jgi:hypothetical protein